MTRSEIASLSPLALLGHAEVAELLQETLDEESAADEKLTAISVESVLPSAQTGEVELATGRRRGSR